MARTVDALRITELYHDRAIELADRAVEVVGSASLIDPMNPVESWRAIIEVVSQVVATAQAQSSALAVGYLAVLASLEVPDEDVALVEDRLDNVGFTADGRTIADALVATRARFFLMRQELTFAEAAKRTGQSLGRLARFEIQDAGQRELLHQADELPIIKGWRSKSRGTCGACLAVDDGIIKGFGRATSPPYHPGCNCIVEVSFDVPEQVRRPTGPERFDELDVLDQVAALGPEKADLIRKGAIDWSALATTERFEDWTPILVETPLKDLVTETNAP